jgi:hypothetical protein
MEKRIMAAPPDNNNAMKFKMSEERQALCQLYCDHMASGLSKDSFLYCDMQTLDRYVKDFPVDFDTKKMDEAERKGRLHWEKMGHEMAVSGQGNATVWIFNMKNRFKWTDRQDITSDGEKVVGPTVYLPKEED